MSTAINLFGTETPKTATKIEKFEALTDVDMRGNTLVISMQVEIDLDTVESLEIIKQLKVSDSGKGYNCVSASLKGVQGFTGNFNVNISAKHIEALKTLIQQNINKKANATK